MASQVAVAEVAVVPTFKGFRKQVTNETDTSAKAASKGFSRTFSKTGTDSGKTVGAGFKKAFEQSSKGTSDKLTKQLEADVAKTSRTLSAARLKEQDAIGKVRVAQAQLNEANKKYASDSSQVIRAQERLATASRQLESAHEGTEDATDDLKRAQGELARAADRAGDELSEAGNRGVKGFRSNVVGGVKSFAGPLIAAFAALGIGQIVVNAFNEAKEFVTSSVDVASDLKESVNAVQVAYGDAADEVLKLGESSAKTFGLSKKDLNAYSTQFSAFVGTIAGSGGDVAGTLQTLIGRGTDFASVFNTDVAEALGLFQSGLAGETEPLRKYGIDLSAAAVEAYALANGIGDGTGALTEAEKVQARYGSLLEQTDKVQGDFVNTSDELANKNRINAAEWENVRAQIGDAFLPVASKLATVLGDDIIPVISDLAEEHGPELAKAFEDALPALVEMAEEVLPELPGLFDSLAQALPAVIDLLRTAGPIIIGLTQSSAAWWTVLGGLFDLLSGDITLDEFVTKLEEIPGPIGDVVRAASDMGKGIGDGFADAVREANNFRNGVKMKVDEVVGFFRSLPGRIGAFFEGAGDWLVDSGRALIRGFIKGIREMFKPVGDAVSAVIDWAKDFFPHSPAKRGPLSGSGWTEIGTSGSALIEQFQKGIRRGAVEAPLSAALTASVGAVAAGAPAIYVQNPFTGEYLLARVASTADQRIRSADAENERALARGKW